MAGRLLDPALLARAEALAEALAVQEAAAAQAHSAHLRQQQQLDSLRHLGAPAAHPGLHPGPNPGALPATAADPAVSSPIPWQQPPPPPAAPQGVSLAAAAAAAAVVDVQAQAPPRWPPSGPRPAGGAAGPPRAAGGGPSAAWRAPPPVSAPSPAAAVFGGGLWGAAPSPAAHADPGWLPSLRSDNGGGGGGGSSGAGSLGSGLRQQSAPPSASRWPGHEPRNGDGLWGAANGGGTAPGAGALDGRPAGGHPWPGGAHSLGITWEGGGVGAAAPNAAWGSAMPGGPGPGGAPPRRSGPSAAAAAGFTGVSEELPLSGGPLTGRHLAEGPLLDARSPRGHPAGPGPASLGMPAGGFGGGGGGGFAAFAAPLGSLGGAFPAPGAQFGAGGGFGLQNPSMSPHALDRGAPRLANGGGAALAGAGKAGQCMACWAAPRDTCCLPCGHVAMCGRCAAAAVRPGGGGCPVCRGPVQNAVLVWGGWGAGLGAPGGLGAGALGAPGANPLGVVHAGPGTPRGGVGAA